MITNSLPASTSVYLGRSTKSVSIAKTLLALTLFVMMRFPAQANTYNVNTTADGTSASGTVNLRGAILAADALGGTHTINVPAGTYNLTLGSITFGHKAQTITINGAGAASTIINMTATNRDRIFFINPTAFIYNIRTTITGVSFTNGHLTSDNYGGGAIIAGGPDNALTITSSVFTNNTIDAAKASAGGAIAYLGGGSLSIDQCLFTANSAPAGSNANGAGGAVDFEAYSFSINNVYTYPDNSLAVTNCVFTNNSVGNNGIGGAINVSAGGFSTVDPPRPTLSVMIAENSFVNNSAPGAGGNGRGGAISATNSFSPTSVFRINYNRFVGNTANVSAGSALISFDTQGSVDASNNWWGCNGGPTSCADKAYRYPGSSSGTLTTAPYLLLRTTAINASLCSSSTATITAGFTLNSANTTVAASNLSAFTGVPIAFNATLGAISSAQTTIQSTGTTTAIYTAGNTAGSGTVNAVVDNVPANDATARASITVNTAPSITNLSGNATTCAGSPTSFSAAASGSGTLTYQWYRGVTALANGATGTGSTISGATAALLTITNTGTADAAANYTLKVSSSTGCSTTSNAIALVVNTPASISSQPASASSVSIGSSVRVQVVVSGQVSSYQWYKGSAIVSGQTSATLNLNSIQLSQAGSYALVATSPCTSVTSTAFSLVVISPDLTPTLYARPSSTYGTTNISVVVDITELNSVPTSGTVTVYVTKDTKAPLSFSATAISVNNRPVQNSAWSFDGTSSGSFYILTTTQVIPADGVLSFGLRGTTSPGATKGVLTLSAILDDGSGGEVKLTNNSDADRINYFAK